MRRLASSVLVAFAALAAVQAAPAAAQDTFGSVTNEPRPEEYLHWDADAIAAKRAELQKRIDDGGGIWGTGFAFDRVLDDAPYRPHSVSIVHRQGYTQPEIHERKWDLYVILEGSGTVLMGGERTGWVDDGRPPERQRPALQGATAFEVTEGDVLHVPARVWHQLLLPEGRSMTYALINVNEPEPAQ
jgi:mannose-6-phosphate isomerase-like protein (cupin superfamily)